MKKNPKGKMVKVLQRCKLRFIDSCRFMQSSLKDLVKSLVGTNPGGDTRCEGCNGDMEFIDIDEQFKAQFKCSNCHASFKSRQLDEKSLKFHFYNLRKHCGSDEEFRLLLRLSLIHI